MSAFSPFTVNIPSGAAATDGFGTAQATRGSLQVPAVLNGAGFQISVDVSNDALFGHWLNCPLEGNEVNPIPVVVSGTYSFHRKVFNYRYVRMNLGTVQDADRPFIVFFRE